MKRGFTLQEVMLALAIFALAAMTVLQIAISTLSNQQFLEEKAVAVWVAKRTVTGGGCRHEDFSQVIQSRFAGVSTVGGLQ
ncbi:TPA: prepilin-type N-terminal cleavage/methylation domain-containing protein [Escherichia coli]|nr:prepilin-type N-terminal cleavage/methylation domain-containing protein [Escherichia coli]